MSAVSLHDHPMLKTPGLAKVIRAISVDGDEVRIVGGAVRNALMGIAVGDLDLATTARPDVVIGRSRAAGLKVVNTGYDHGTVTVVAGGHGYEVTTLRRDVRTDGRRAEVAYGRDWTEDAKRRDFTMNALYADLSGTVYDPLGGLDDCLAHRLRFIGDAEQRIKEDYLRILRFFRFFATYGGALDAAGLAACAKHSAGLNGLSRERIGQEIKKLLPGAHAISALEAMIAAEIAPMVLGPVVDIAAFTIARARAGKIDAMGALLILAVRGDEDIARLGEGLRLSKVERGRLDKGLAARRLIAGLSTPAMRLSVYRQGAQAAQDALLMASLRLNDADFSTLWDIATAWSPPRPPFSAQEIMAQGYKGAALGARLRELEQAWIDETFKD